MLPKSHKTYIETHRQRIDLAFEYPVVFSRDVFDPDNRALADLLNTNAPHIRTQLFFDAGLLDAWQGLHDDAVKYFAKHIGKPALPPVVLPGGEQVKEGWEHTHSAIDAIRDANLCRHSFVIAVGGGAFLDTVGFATALVHRGIRLIRLPSTTLSQGDSGVGVKNGINLDGKKNLIGAFAPPFAVVNDLSLLETLPREPLLDGIAEVFKVAIIKDRELFELLSDSAEAINSHDMKIIGEAVRRSALIHLEHIASAGDPFEIGEARPLDFGHWTAHRLESVSGYRISHGRGVAIGIALDATYAVLLKLITNEQCEAICSAIARCGLPTFDPLLLEKQGNRYSIFDGIEEFREHLGGRLSITLPEGIGQCIEVNTIDERLMSEAIERLSENANP